MNPRNPEHEFNPGLSENERLNFTDKLQDLLPGVEFEEPGELLEARMAVLEALTKNDQDPNFIQSVWIEYTKICEQIVDDKTEAEAKAKPHIRAQLQITMLVHKALIFREVGDKQHYGEDLSDAEDYALNMHFDRMAAAIGIELDDLTG